MLEECSVEVFRDAILLWHIMHCEASCGATQFQVGVELFRKVFTAMIHLKMLDFDMMLHV